MAEERPIVDMQELLKKRQQDGKSIVVIEAGAAAAEYVEALKKMLPEDKQDAAGLVDLDKVKK